MSDLSPASAKLLNKLCSPHALTWGGVFVRYDSPDEIAYPYPSRTLLIGVRIGILHHATYPINTLLYPYR